MAKTKQKKAVKAKIAPVVEATVAAKIRFTPTDDFFSVEFQSHYVAGLTYTIRPEDSKLREIVMKEWLPQVKVILVNPPLTASIEGA